MNQERYDIIGDVHGCYDALRRLSNALGYDEEFRHSDGRTLIFVGDLADRGPESVRVLCTMSRLVSQGRARMTLGNHDDALLRRLCGQPVDTHKGGLDKTLAELEARPDSKTLKRAIGALLEQAALYLVLDGGALIVAHAGIEEEMVGKTDPETRRFVLNGDAIGKSPDGKTLRRDWAADYAGQAFVVYGHTPQDCAVIRHNTVNIDTGAYRGGLLTAVRWPEQTLVSVTSNFHAQDKG
jgi:protein phosphatase